MSTVHAPFNVTHGRDVRSGSYYSHGCVRGPAPAASSAERMIPRIAPHETWSPDVVHLKTKRSCSGAPEGT